MEEGLEMGREASESIWRIKEQDHKSTSTCSSKEERKIPSRNRYIRTCYKRSVVLRIRRKMRAHCVFIMQLAERNYKIYDKELLAIVEVLRK